MGRTAHGMPGNRLPIACRDATTMWTRVDMAAEEKKSDSIESLGSVIEKIMQSGIRKQDAPLLKVWELWEKAVGEIIAENARPAAFKGKILLVHVNSSPWMHQLHFLKNDILARINRELGQDLVDEIKFKIGPL